MKFEGKKQWPVNYKDHVQYGDVSCNNGVESVFSGKVDFREDSLCFDCTRVDTENQMYRLVSALLRWPLGILMVVFWGNILFRIKTYSVERSMPFGLILLIAIGVTVAYLVAEVSVMNLFKTKSQITVPFGKITKILHFLEKNPSRLEDKEARKPQKTSIIALIYTLPGTGVDTEISCGVAFDINIVQDDELQGFQQKLLKGKGKNGISLMSSQRYIDRCFLMELMNSLPDLKITEASLWKRADGLERVLSKDDLKILISNIYSPDGVSS